MQITCWGKKTLDCDYEHNLTHFSIFQSCHVVPGVRYSGTGMETWRILGPMAGFVITDLDKS